MGFINLFKKKGVKPQQTSKGLKYQFSKMNTQANGQVSSEQATTLSLLHGSNSVHLKGYTPTGAYVDETYNIIGSPEHDSVTGRTWNPIGIDGELLMWIAISELRDGFGLTIKFPNNAPGTFFFYR